MPSINLSHEMVDLWDQLITEGESYEQVINELTDIYQSTELSLAYGDGYV